MFSPISIDKFLKDYKKSNPKSDVDEMRAVLIETVEGKKNGTVCNQCEQPIWAVGSAIVGWNGCFTCITGEADSSEDYEIDSVCF